jgi:folate-binding protein YgfZ
MTELALREFHRGLNATLAELNGMEVVDHYGDPAAEQAAFSETCAVADLSFRSRLCLTGADRQPFLHGQVTNEVKALRPGEGVYAALVTAKGKLQSDLNIFVLKDELLLDFELGLTTTVAARLEKYIIADDVQVVDVAPHYGLLTVQGPRAAEAVPKLELGIELPARPLTFAAVAHATLGELYVINQPRLGAAGFDVFAPQSALAAILDKLISAARELGGRAGGWQGLEAARIEAGIPRFGADMDESNLAPECGIEARAISYSKGCYIGQEVIARIRTYGQVAKSLRGLRLADDLGALPVKGDRLFKDDREAGYITSALASKRLGANLALGYVRREFNEIGAELTLRTAAGEGRARIVPLPFTSERSAGL